MTTSWQDPHQQEQSDFLDQLARRDQVVGGQVATDSGQLLAAELLSTRVQLRHARQALSTVSAQLTELASLREQLAVAKRRDPSRWPRAAARRIRRTVSR